MKKYRFLYPAIFIKDEDGSCQVLFPDLNIYTDGKNMSDAYFYAEDLLRVYFSYALKYETDYNMPSKLEDVVKNCKPNEVAMYISTTVEQDK